MKKLFCIVNLLIIFQFVSEAQNEILTTAEKTNYTSTSTYDEVIEFITTLENNSDKIRVETFAKSIEGRDLPLMIIADPLPDAKKMQKNDERIVVYIQANIHAGEVEGKEATQMLARDLLNGKNPEIFKDVILLICPILNADGNEKPDLENRTNQNGPANGVGVRHNGQHLDLNRDAMKLETPEIKGVVTEIFNNWDPAVTVDCHATNGSFHEEPVTFTWMMNPNGSRTLINYMRDVMMPKINKALWNDHEVENVFYGEFIDRLDYDKGWISYAAEPRFLVNYVGLRNRLAILNENYVYADFKTRVNGCYHLLLSILEYAAENKNEIKELIVKVDESCTNSTLKPIITDSFAIDYVGRPIPEKIVINAIEADTIPGIKGYWRFKQSNRKRTIAVDYIADYYPSKSIKLPYAYVFSVPDQEVIKLLKAHGIKVERLGQKINLEVERFKITSLFPSNRLYQGHYMNTVKGEYIIEKKEFEGGSYFVRTSQPLGKLTAYLLEPESDDGLLKWNFWDKYLVPQWGSHYFPYPVYRIIKNQEF